MATPPAPEESVSAGRRRSNSATDLVRSLGLCLITPLSRIGRQRQTSGSPEPFRSIEVGLVASATDEATARKESQDALESSDSAQFGTSSNSHGVTSQGGHWRQEEGSGGNCEFVAGRLPLAGRLLHGAEFITGRLPLAENEIGTHVDAQSPESSAYQASVGDGNCNDHCELSGSETESEPPSPWLDEPVEASSPDTGGIFSFVGSPLSQYPQDCPPAGANSIRQWNTGEGQPESIPKAFKTFLWKDEPWSEEVSGSDEPALLVSTCGPSDFDASLEVGTHLQKMSPEPKRACEYSQFGCTFMGDSLELTFDEQDSSSYRLKSHSDEVQCMGREGSIVGQSTSLREQSLKLVSTVPNFQEGCSTLKLKLLSLEATSYNGDLIWKIPEPTRRTAEARIGKTISLYSAPFYTSRFGYKMCLRLYLNGDGSGKGTHLSFFLTVMRGEYDALLSWPFKQMVTLTLLDQDMRKNIVQAFCSEPSSSSFWKPKTAMNVASGFPFFLAIMRGEYDALLSWPIRQMVTIIIPPNQEKRK